ncbi:MAG: phosphatase PAP2 family protein [Rhodobacteraceae bacterium]|nr:phosphatase PAP2 family protein [Paracoccaceae bacterium]
MKTYTLFTRILIALLVAVALVSVIFVGFPQLDIMVSSFFTGADHSFPISQLSLPKFLRSLFLNGMYLFILIILLIFGTALILGRKRHVPLQVWAYPVVVVLVGPLLLVNSVLKNQWGRARPADIMEFSGDLLFTPAYYISDQCPTNCSFTSGEGGAIATLAVLIGVLFWQHTKRRGLMVLGLSLLVFVGAGLRVAFGGHFLSDTLLSVLFCSLIALFFYRIFDLDTHLPKFTLTNVKADLRQLRRNKR